MEKRKVQILPPEEHTGITISNPEDKAAGMKAVSISLKHVSEELGLLPGLKILSKMNQVDGFDCPGCAWPDPQDRSSLGEYCENGAKALAEEATNKRVDPAFFKKYSVEEMSTWSDFKIGKSGRLTHPMILKKGSSHYEPISWEDASIRIAEKLKSISPDEAVFYTSGRTSNETAFMYQLMVRAYGTNNLPDCSNMCHESSGVGLSETVGIGKGSVTLEDLYEAEVIMVVGQNPGTNHPRMLTALQKCKKNGGKVVHVNPLPEAGTQKFVDPQSPVEVLKGGTKIADHFLQVRINGDIALLQLIMHQLILLDDKDKGSVLDHEFIQENCVGFEDFKTGILALDKEKALRDCGISMHKINEVVELLANNEKIIICWAMGITQHINGVNNVKEIVNLLLMKGSIGKPGAGTCPVRGHSNVQGDRTMGIYEKPSEAFLSALDSRFDLNSNRAHGYDVVDSIEAMSKNKVRFFMAMGGNFISATPDSELTGQSMQNCELTVQVSTKLNRAHLVTGQEAIILPCLTRSEQDIQNGKAQFMSVENSMGVVHSTRGSMQPASKELKSEASIVGLIGKILTDNPKINWDEMTQDYGIVRDHIEAVIPGFKNYNERIKHSHGFYLPNGARARKFTTASGKAHFTKIDLPQVDPKEGEFIMTTIRSHDQYNTTIYGLDDRYRGISNERRVVLMNPSDMESKGLKKESVVSIKSHFNGEIREVRNFIVVPFDIPSKCVATYFPETNALVPLKSVAKKSNTPASKFVEVTIELG